MTAFWSIRGGRISLDRPRILGILNITPDSFSDGGRYATPDAAVARAERLVAEGADVIDIGGESTRPGATPVPPAEEIRRTVTVIALLSARFPRVPLSIDTVKSAVAAAALDAGAQIVNDVSGFRLDGRMGEICAAKRAGVVLMHSRGTVAEMATYEHAHYDDVVEDVVTELGERVAAAVAAGVGRDAIVVDPGIGFGKRGAHSLALLANVPRLATLGFPVLIGASRKRFIGEITGVSEAAARAAGSVGAHVAALLGGARLFRVHDVREHREALDTAWAVMTAGEVPA